MIRKLTFKLLVRTELLLILFTNCTRDELSKLVYLKITNI